MLPTTSIARTLDYENFEGGHVIPVIFLVYNTIQNQHFRFLGVEEITTKNRMTFRCHKISILLVKGDFSPDGEYMKI